MPSSPTARATTNEPPDHKNDSHDLASRATTQTKHTHLGSPTLERQRWSGSWSRVRGPRSCRCPDWYEEMHERQREAHSSRRIRVERGIAHLKNWRALTRPLGRCEHMDETGQAIAGLLSQQQTADRGLAWQT